MQVDIAKYKFGIFGMGFLGTAIVHGFGLHAQIKSYDKYLKGFDSIDDVVEHADFIWMCLPTPMQPTGEIDLSILEENLEEIHKRVSGEYPKKVVIIKSTVTPGTTEMFQEKYPKLDFVMNPEFLTARNNKLDFICASRIIIGFDGVVMDECASLRLKDVYEYRFGNSIPIYLCSTKEAELTKYGANCFFAVKISYFNYIHDMCDKLGINFNNVKDMILADGRIGRSHSSVPGWDGQRGYSGVCFPKDINALIALSKSIGANPELLEASWSQNLKDRPSKDWEKMPGAISKK